MADNQLKYKGIVLRTGVNLYGRFLDSLEQKATKNCIKNITESTFRDYIVAFASKPMFSKYYLVYAELNSLDGVEKAYFDFLEMLITIPWVKLIIKVSSYETFDKLKYIKVFKSFMFLDCYNQPKEILEKYIRRELIRYGADQSLITDDCVSCIRRRVRHKEYVLDGVLPQLACTGLTKREIFALITPYKGVTLNNFGSRFFEPERKRPIAEFLQKYYKYPDSLYKAVMAYIEKWFKLYEDYISGELSHDNIINWIDTKGKQFDINYEYQASTWLQSFSRYSYDWMVFVFIELQAVSRANSSQKILALYKIYRMVNCCG